MTAILIFLSLLGCTDVSSTVTTLKKAGYTQIQTKGYDFFACSQDDFYSTKFSAVNPAGTRVSGVVCCGVFKSCTIRF